MEVIQDSQLYVVIALPAALFAGFTTLSAMRHMIVHKNYGWLVSTVFLVFVSAYLYGLLVATKQKKDTV